MEEVFIRISLWPDGTWCEEGDEANYLQWMSDDYKTVEMTENEYDEFLRTH